MLLVNRTLSDGLRAQAAADHADLIEKAASLANPASGIANDFLKSFSTRFCCSRTFRCYCPRSSMS